MLLKNGQRVNGKKDYLPMKKTAIFELSENYTRYDQKNKKKTRNNKLSMPTSYLVFSEADNENLEYRYAEVETPGVDKSGNVTKSYRPNKIFFEKGFLVVPTTQPDLYTWLMTHPKLNKTFILKDAAVIATKSVSDRKLVFQAEAKILGENALDQKTLVNVLISTGNKNVSELTFDEVKDELLNMARKNPGHFLSICESKDLNMKVLIQNAIKYKVLGFKDEENKFTWGANTSSKGNLIVAVPIGIDNPVPFFMDWLVNADNSGVLEQLKLSVEQSMNKAKKEAVTV